MKRAVGLVSAIVVIGIAFIAIRSNLRTDAGLAAVLSKDAAAARRALEQRPDLVSTQVMPQGSRSTTNAIRWRGRTLLHEVLLAPSGALIEVAETLVAFGADLKARIDGDTLLHLAAANDDLAVVTWLLDKGADVNARNGCEQPDAALCSSGEFAHRRAPGPVCTGCDHDGETALHAAQRSGNVSQLSTLLLERGADVRAPDAKGRTALHIAGQSARVSPDSRVLCAYGADPLQRDKSGQTPADLARESDAAHTVDRYAATGPGELAGWLAAGGGCAQIAARARPGTPVRMDDVDAAWKAYSCTRDAMYCEKQ